MADLRSFRKVDPETYRAFKAQAVLEDRPVGIVLNEAMQAYLEGARPAGRGRGRGQRN